jgi:ubiquinone/menaquinone biosynthesis C-methylase UbiE
MNCDRIARPYRWIEYAAFGRRLERHRFRFLPETRNSRNALLLGDGDGRFAAALARINSHVRIDCIESSARMIQVAKERLETERITAPERIHFLQADALRVKLHPAHYDLIVTNFFLDCFSTSQVLALITPVREACCPGARWMVSDFQRPSSGWRALYANIWLRTMYLFFRVVTGLKTSTLPAYAEALRSAGFVLQSRHSSMASFICSELWTLTE